MLHILHITNKCETPSSQSDEGVLSTLFAFYVLVLHVLVLCHG